MPKGGKEKNSKTKTSTEPYPKKGGKPQGDLTDPETLYCDRCTSDVERLIQCEKCEMYLCSSCEKIPESVMATIGEYSQIHWFCMYCDTLVCKSSNFGQVCTIESLTNVVQSSVSLSLKKTISQKLQSIEEKLRNLEITCSSSSNVVSHTEEFDSPMVSPTHQSRPRLSDTFNSTSEVLNSYIHEEKERSRRRLNVIVHNVAEPSAESGSERKSHDISNVASSMWGLRLMLPMPIG